jgi:hypothetical protein
MRIAFKRSFIKDIGNVQDTELRKTVADVIESVERADSLFEIQNLKKTQGR